MYIFYSKLAVYIRESTQQWKGINLYLQHMDETQNNYAKWKKLLKKMQ